MRTQILEEQFNNLIKQIWPLTKGFDLLPDHVIITDPHGNVVYANRAVQQQTGYSKDEVVGKNPGDLWGGQMPDKFYKDMWQTIRDFKMPFVGQVKNKKKDGAEYWQELRIYPILDDKKEIKFYIGIEPNINLTKIKTELKERYLAEMERLHNYLMERTRKMDELEKQVSELKERLADKTASEDANSGKAS